MKKEQNYVLPIYVMGAVFFLYALIFPIFRLTDIIIAVALSILAYITSTALAKQQTKKRLEKELGSNIVLKSGIKEADGMLELGRDYILRLKALNQTISEPAINNKIKNLITISTQIFDFIIKNPSHIRKITTFMDYYYPLALKLLESYEQLSAKAVKGQNISETIAKISTSLLSIEDAFKHQLDNLYSDKAMDISTDIAVLKNIMSKEGIGGE